MDVSVVIICLNEETNITPCLHSLLKQTFPKSRYEIIVVDGGSRDRTQDLVREIENAHENVRLVVELKKGAAAGRNAGVKAAKKKYVAFIDADCEAPPDWITTLLQNYEEAKKRDDAVIAVGGANIPPKNAPEFIQAIGVALDSYPGSFGSVQGRQYKKPVYVSSLANCNVLYEKGRIVEIGYFDDSLGSEGEDADINYRLNRSGHRFLFIPESFVWHKMRPTPIVWFKNMFRYGKGRARLLKRHKDMWAPGYVLPLIFFAGMSSVLLIPFSKIFTVSLFYFPVLFCYSVFQCLRKQSLHLTLLVMLVYIIQHFGYATGELYGLINPKVK